MGALRGVAETASIGEAQPKSPEAAPWLPPSELVARDEELLTELHEKLSGGSIGDHQGYRNDDLAARAQPSYTLSQLRDLERLLKERGTHSIAVPYGMINVDEEARRIPFVPATETRAAHGDMSEKVYLRDHIQTAWAFIELHQHDPERYSPEGAMGRNLLLSAFHMLSTNRQLERQQDVIRLRGAATQLQHPHITLEIADLNSEKDLNWRHRQDTQAMMAHLSFQALGSGFISDDDLSDRHRRMLADFVPYLDACGYPYNDHNSGSWEENAVPKRTSVTAVQVAALHALLSLVTGDSAKRFTYLESGWQVHMSGGENTDFVATLDAMIHRGAAVVGRQLPFETPDEEVESIRYRELDATLVYLLRYNTPDILASRRIPIGKEGNVCTEQEIVDIIVDRLSTLVDPVTGGMKRYQRDSYERVNFHTNATQWLIKRIKRHVQEKSDASGRPVDLEEKQRLRDALVPSGREAMWTLPVNQLLAAHAHRTLRLLREQGVAAAEASLETTFSVLNQTLGLITGHDEYHIELQPDGSTAVAQTPAYRFPESFNTVDGRHGQRIIASPHTPLHWSVAMHREGLGILAKAVEQIDLHRAGPPVQG
ncbi:hypothetical protein [Actinoplanes sp. NPDC089786]|uniref:hypothetical protein n=1 Tax=Actinoplanes sp. NPDC089786 TaxID=3155185 RepID=UPI0034263BD2